jgi:hypothetical protein
MNFFQVNSSDILFHWRRIVLGISVGKIPRNFPSEVPCPDRVICVEGWRIEFFFFTCNVTKKYFVTLYFISLRYVIRYVTIFNFSLRYRVTLHKFFVTLRFFRYVTFRVQIPETVITAKLAITRNIKCI